MMRWMVVAAVYNGGNLPTPDPLNHYAAAVASSPSWRNSSPNFWMSPAVRIWCSSVSVRRMVGRHGVAGDVDLRGLQSQVDGTLAATTEFLKRVPLTETHISLHTL